MWLGGSVGLRALECPFLNLWRTIRTLEPVPPPVSGPQMWALVVPLVHSQLNHLFFRKREGERGGKGEGAKKGGRKIQPGKKKDKKRNKIFFKKAKSKLLFLQPLRNSLGGSQLVYQWLSCSLQILSIHFPLRLVVCRAGETNQNPP